MSLKWVGSGCSSFWTVVSVSKGWGLREFFGSRRVSMSSGPKGVAGGPVQEVAEVS